MIYLGFILFKYKNLLFYQGCVDFLYLLKISRFISACFRCAVKKHFLQRASYVLFILSTSERGLHIEFSR